MDEHVQEIARRFFDEQDRRRAGPAGELCADGYTAYLAGFPPMDLADHTAFAASFYIAFPDLRHDIHDVIADGDRAAVRFRLIGTNDGEFLGNPPSGKAIDAGGLVLMTVIAGQVSELCGEFDQLGVLQQIAAI